MARAMCYDLSIGKEIPVRSDKTGILTDYVVGADVFVVEVEEIRHHKETHVYTRGQIVEACNGYLHAPWIKVVDVRLHNYC